MFDFCHVNCLGVTPNKGRSVQKPGKQVNAWFQHISSVFVNRFQSHEEALVGLKAHWFSCCCCCYSWLWTIFSYHHGMGCLDALKSKQGTTGQCILKHHPEQTWGAPSIYLVMFLYTPGISSQKPLQTLKKKAPSHPGFLVFTHQELPSVRLLEGDVHWTNDNSPSLEPTEIAAVMTTRGCGPGNQVTRQCVKAAKNYRTLDLFLRNNVAIFWEVLSNIFLVSTLFGEDFHFD